MTYRSMAFLFAPRCKHGQVGLACMPVVRELEEASDCEEQLFILQDFEGDAVGHVVLVGHPFDLLLVVLAGSCEEGQGTIDNDLTGRVL